MSKTDEHAECKNDVDSIKHCLTTETDGKCLQVVRGWLRWTG